MSQSLESVNVSLYDKRDFPEIKDLEMKRLAWMVQGGPIVITRVIIRGSQEGQGGCRRLGEMEAKLEQCSHVPRVSGDRGQMPPGASKRNHPC